MAGDSMEPLIISIHAPAKGATPRPLKLSSILLFQSTLPRRERRLVIEKSSATFTFQSTLPRRERQDFGERWHPVAKFQSTLPRRERQSKFVQSPLYFKFQSTLPRRERRERISDSLVCKFISIHAPAKGATLLSSVDHYLKHYFNPRSREGSDPW